MAATDPPAAAVGGGAGAALLDDLASVQLVSKPSSLPPISASPLSTTKALLLSVIFPRVHHVFVPPSQTEKEDGPTSGTKEEKKDESSKKKSDRDGRRVQFQTNANEEIARISDADSDSGSGSANNDNIDAAVKEEKGPIKIIVDTSGADAKKKKATVNVVKDEEKQEVDASKDTHAAPKSEIREDKSVDGTANNQQQQEEEKCDVDDDDNDNDDDNDEHDMELGYVEGDDEKGEEHVEHVVTAEEMAAVVKLPKASEVDVADNGGADEPKMMAAEATKRIKTFFGIVNEDEKEKPTIHLSRSEAVDALKSENDIVDEIPNTAIKVEALIRITFKDMISEGHLFNAPIYTDIKTTHDNDDEMWCELSVMVKTASIGVVLERLERIGVGSSVGTLAIFKAELCRTAYDYGKAISERSQRNDPPLGSLERKNTNVSEKAGGDGDREDKSNIEAARAEWKNAASRLRVEQVKEQIHEQSALSLDFLALLAIASILAGIGLITDNTVVIVASMLVSPIMGPVMGMTFGARINDWILARKSFGNEIVALLISVSIGASIGFTSSWSESAQYWPTGEMESRGDTTGLITGICIAIPSGMGVALSILGNNTASLVGVAISASLLPPAVNAGICWAHAILISAGAVTTTANGDSFGRIGGISFALTVVNIVCIWVAGIVMFAIKEVAPTKAKSAFWSRDIKVARAQKTHKEKDVDVEVIRKGLSDALEKERKKEEKRKKAEEAPMASMLRRKRLVRKQSGPRAEVTFNLAVNPVPIDDISKMDSYHARKIGLEPFVNPFPVPNEKENVGRPSQQTLADVQFSRYAYGSDADTKRPLQVDDVQYVGLEDMAALLGFDEEEEEGDSRRSEESSLQGEATAGTGVFGAVAHWFSK